MEQRLELLKRSPARAIVGIEAGSADGRIGAVLVEVSGSGDSTVLDLHAFKSVDLPSELRAALDAVSGNDGIDPQEQTGVSFLILHHINTLFFELLGDAGIEASQIDLIGLKGLEIGGMEFPDDPGSLSEMTGCIVASCFRIGPERGAGNWLPVKEAILKGLVDEMVEKYDLDEEVREAVAVALLANESVYHESLGEKCLREGSGNGAFSTASRTVRGPAVGKGGPALHGEFFFPLE